MLPAGHLYNPSPSPDEMPEGGEVGQPPALKRHRSVSLSSMDDYQDMKVVFEVNHFKCVSNYYRFDSVSRRWEQMNRTAIRDAYEHVQCEVEVTRKGKPATETKPFINLWLADPSIRKVRAVQCLPPPLVCPEGVQNIWDGLPVSKYPQDGRPYLNEFDLIRKHIYAMCGEDPDVYNFLDCWIASILQKPGTKTKIMPVLRSAVKGAGKGALKDILFALIGLEYCLQTSNPKKELFGPFNAALKDKLLVCIDETSQAANATSSIQAIMEELKSLITEPFVNVRDLYQKMDQSRPSFVNIILLTNREIVWEHEDRRPLFLDATGRFKGDTQHFNNLYSALNNQGFVRALYDYYMGMDLSEVDLERDRPVTALHKAMEQRTCPTEVQFLINYGFVDRKFYDYNTMKLQESHNVLSRDLFEQYKQFVQDHRNYAPLNQIQLGQRLGSLLRDGMRGLQVQPSKRGSVYRFQVAEFRQWLLDSNWWSEETGEEYKGEVDTSFGYHAGAGQGDG